MPHFALVLLSVLTSNGLATSLRQSAAPAASSRKCNVQDSKGARFLVDNSKLRANTRGLSFRRTKDNEARDQRTIAIWGSEVMGLDEGDGWVKVGDCFLPMLLKDVPILRSMEAEASQAKADLSQVQHTKTRPVATLDQGQEQSAQTSTEAQLRDALAEAAEVTQAVAEHLKAERAKNQEFEEEITELKEQAEVLTQTNTELESKLQQKELEKVNVEKRLLQAEIMNRELSQRLEKVSLAAKFGTAQNSAAATGMAEEEVAKMNKQREQLQATLDEVIASAQRTSSENTENFNHLYKKIKSLKKQLEEAHEREELLRVAANATANSTANATAKAAAQHVQTLVAAVAGKVEANSPNAAGAASSAEILELQARLESSQRKSKELAAQVKKVQAQSDQFLVMAGGQIKDIQAKMAKNNHTFQLRFEACERRNTVLSASCDAAKQQLRGEGAASNASGVNASGLVASEAEPLANAPAQLLRGDARVGVESRAAVQAAAEDAVQSRAASTLVLPSFALALLLTALPATC
eukprot:CAMPEP_0171077718 /NCGR_PEP_ID=MMETSP0766_2-20121228/14206_1 /TAXON_ID=439317 /ORGANISM="Gambierdiscus australes, Strain CAWD 149" /LENGTH=524 /DNA_ID=CAMNT_0011534797 /DNA_START=69 /DNA_END=1643 /DNA_ORIENTATION=-